jgi:cytochrome c-type biogenesis protein CcmH/NrfG
MIDLHDDALPYIDPQTVDEARLQMVAELHRAVFGRVWARPESPAEVWRDLLDRVTRVRSRRPLDGATRHPTRTDHPATPATDRRDLRPRRGAGVILLVAVPAVALFLAWRWIETPVPPTMPPPRRRDEVAR